MFKNIYRATGSFVKDPKRVLFVAVDERKLITNIGNAIKQTIQKAFQEVRRDRR